MAEPISVWIARAHVDLPGTAKKAFRGQLTLTRSSLTSTGWRYLLEGTKLIVRVELEATCDGVLGVTIGARIKSPAANAAHLLTLGQAGWKLLFAARFPTPDEQTLPDCLARAWAGLRRDLDLDKALRESRPAR